MTNSRRYSLRSRLFLLVAVCVAPALVMAGILIHQQYRIQLNQVEQSTQLVARKTVADLDRELSAIESALKVLATSSDLKAGDFRSFHARARSALPSGIVYNYILTDRSGRQVLNTLQPYGQALPSTGTPAELQRVFSEARPVLTNFFIGPVTRKPGLAMGVPVFIDDKVAYSLNIGLSPDRINAILQRQHLPKGWIAAVIDGSQTLVGRSVDADRYIGQAPVAALARAVTERREGQLDTFTKDGVPVFTAFATSDNWGWRVAVGAPKVQLFEELKRTIALALGGVALTILMGTWFAWLLARRVLASVRGLNNAALDLAHGHPVSLPDNPIQEADAVGEAIVEAERLMNEVRFLAHHDPLTRLPNRLLFEQLAEHQLALVERNHQPQVVALMAIDLDGFKQVNDQLGHAVGDEVLKQVAARLNQVVRGSDVAARFGGDEFTILLCGTDMHSLHSTAQRVRDVLSARYDGVDAPVSASIGVAIYPQHGQNLRQLMAQADRALYQAKAQGKCCAVVAPE